MVICFGIVTVNPDSSPYRTSLFERFHLIAKVRISSNLARTVATDSFRGSSNSVITSSGMKELVWQHRKFSVLIHVCFQGRALWDNVVFSRGGD